MDFNQIFSFMMNMVMIKFMFNDLAHAVGLYEPFDTDGTKLQPTVTTKYIAGEKVETKISSPKFIGMSDPISINEGLRQSMREEETAIAKYGTRAANARLNGDELTARIYEEIARDEDGHYNKFGTRLRERMSGQISTSAAVEMQ